MKRTFTASLWLEGDWFIAQCLEIDIASQGETPELALANLQEAIALHLEAPHATLLPQVRTIEIDLAAD
jgi:predicted RNase H-like HicB family nuclease